MANELEAEQDLEEAIESGRTLVDFYAAWCGPCAQMRPLVEDLHEEGNFDVIKVDVDENPSTAQAFNVRSIPTFIAFEEGEELGSKIGAGSKAELEQLFQTEE